MTSEKITIPCSVHGRFAQKIVFGANTLDSQIYLEKDDRRINVGSLLGLLSLSLQENDEVLCFVVGDTADKEQRDLKAFTKLFSEKS